MTPDRRWSSATPGGNNALVPLRAIRTDGGTQARATLDSAKVKEYIEALQDGAHFPPVVLYYDGTAYWLADGFHRVAAYQHGSPPEYGIPADVRPGTRRDAVLFACGANATHGLPRSPEDKERAVLTLLRDEEWGQWSYREIARRCNVSHDFVRKTAERHQLTGRASSEKIYTTKHSTTATINTANIAAANAARAETPGREELPPDAPRPGAIHPLIATLMEPEIARPGGIDWPQRFIEEPPAIPMPPELLLKGWSIRPPSATSSVYRGYNDRVGISTHGYVEFAGAITAAQKHQAWIEEIEALDWTIQHVPDDPQFLYATHPDHAPIIPVLGLYALHRQVLAVSVIPCAMPVVGTQATRPDETDLGDRLHAIGQAGYTWKGAAYTADGWRHLLVRRDAPDMVRQRLTVAGIDRLLQLDAAPVTEAAASDTTLPTAGAGHQEPIVPQVLVLAGQPNPYQLPQRTICDVLGHTAEMVSCRYPDGRVGKRRQENVYCLPSPEAAERVEAAFTRYQATLMAIADELRRLGTYAARLAEAGDITGAPNPLTPTVIFAPEPDGYHAPSYDHALKVPRAERSVVLNHTPKMLRIEHSAATISGQQGHFVCPDAAAWERLEQQRAAATQAHDELVALLAELGTYQDALADGRYQHQVERTAPVHPEPAIDWRRVNDVAAHLSVCTVYRDRTGLIATALDLLRLLVEPGQIVLPLYPTEEAEALIAEIRVLLEQQLDVAAPNVGRLLRAVGRYGDGPPND